MSFSFLGYVWAMAVCAGFVALSVAISLALSWLGRKQGRGAMRAVSVAQELRAAANDETSRGDTQKEL